MKKYVLILLCVAIPALSVAQPASVRKASCKYGHKEGVTRITIPGIVMDFASWFVDDKETAKMLRSVNKIKVLAFEDSERFHDVNLVDEIMGKFKANSFEEMLAVRSDNEDVAIYIRERSRNRKELLVIAGGSDDNAIVYLKGKITPEMLGMIGNEMKVDALKSL